MVKLTVDDGRWEMGDEGVNGTGDLGLEIRG